MYYNSNKNSNDYYNSYKQELAELQAYKREESLQEKFKLFLSALVLLLFLLGTFYLYQYFNQHFNEEKYFFKNNSLTNIIIREEQLPQSIQFNDTNKKSLVTIEKKTEQLNTNMSEKDIALIVQIIMSQMRIKQEIPLEEQLEQITYKKFEATNLKESNHYNKIILSRNEKVEGEGSSLMELSDKLNDIIDEGMDGSSSYLKEIKKEIVFRENEMRIIIVQKGDTLSRIAEKAYGDHNDYSKIFSANPELIENPNQIFVGQRLRIPS